MKVFVDSNIVLDVLLNRGEFYESSAEVLTACMNDGTVGATSALSVCNIAYVMRKYMPSHIVEEKLLALLEVVDVLDTTGSSVRECLGQEHSDFEDAVQMRSAVEWQAEVIVTRDKEGFYGSPVPVCTPQEFVDQFSW